MADITFALDRSSALTLQEQLRQRIIEAVYTGALRPGRKVPSSRALASQLGVSRNTVVLAYADLLAEGHLVARDRSGIFVSHDLVQGRLVGQRVPESVRSPIAERMSEVAADTGIRCPQYWRQYAYPFRDGCIDAVLNPVSEWRKAVRMASAPRDAAHWSDGNGELDDASLIDELRTKVLPERGISALPEQILVMESARQALQYLTRLLVKPGTSVWLEEPVDAELAATLRQQNVHVSSVYPGALGSIPEGLVVITSVRSGVATGARLTSEDVDEIGAHNGIVIDLTTPADTDEPGACQPALHANAACNNVIHVGRLSPVAAGSTPPAFVVSDPQVIARLRRLRRVNGTFPDPLQQRAWAYFLSFGYYGACVNRARDILGARKIALRDALNHYLHMDVRIQTIPGASVYWVRCRDGRDAQALAYQAAAAGVLIQPASLDAAGDAFTLGVTGLGEDAIRSGVRALANVIHASPSSTGLDVWAHPASGRTAIRRAIVGKRFLYNTVYGDPCTIQVCRSGELLGTAGYANEDPDRGRWWIEDNRWFRQWDNWAYAEAEGFAVAVDDERIYWYDADGKLVDHARFLHGSAPESAPTRSASA